MYVKLFLGLLTAALMIDNVSAQSGSSNKGSSTKASTAIDRQQQKIMTLEVNKLAKKIEKNEFTGIKLDSKQKRSLKTMLKENFDQIAAVEQSMVSMIPTDKAADLKRKYSAALRKGSTEDEAMLTAMQEVGFDESLQDKIMTLSGELDAVTREVAENFSSELNAEQQEAYAALKAKKEAMVGEKTMGEEKMMDGEKTMDGEETEGEEMEGDTMQDKEMEAAGSDSKTAGSDSK